MFSERFETALTFAAVKHDGQHRKGGQVPYLTHLVHVARLLEPYGEDAAVAGLLHDVLEDTDTSVDEIQRFGPVVVDAVLAVSEEKKRSDGSKIPWKERKEAYLAHLERASELAVLVSCADKVHNVATLSLQLDADGEEVWRRFRGTPEQTVWFYRAVANVVAARLRGHPLARELQERVTELERRAPSKS